MKISTLFLGGALLMSTSAMAQDNLLAKANEGALGDKGAMAQNGWECWKFPFSYDEIEEEFTFDTPEQITWDASGPGGNGVRWENKSSVVTYNGAAYNSPICFFRWDNGSMHGYWFIYPVEITKPGIYKFSMLGGEWSNTSADNDNSYLKTDGNSSAVMVTFSDKMGPEGINWEGYADGVSDQELEISPIGIPAPGEGKLFTFEKTQNDHATLQKCETELDATKAGKYYLQITGSHAITCLADFQLTFAAELPGGSAVEEIGAEVETAVEYYGIDGVKVTNPAKGSLVIEKKIMSDGSVKVSKKIAR